MDFCKVVGEIIQGRRRPPAPRPPLRKPKEKKMVHAEGKRGPRAETTKFGLCGHWFQITVADVVGQFPKAVEFHQSGKNQGGDIAGTVLDQMITTQQRQKCHSPVFTSHGKYSREGFDYVLIVRRFDSSRNTNEF